MNHSSVSNAVALGKSYRVQPMDHMRLVFVIVIKFFDDTGASDRCYSNRLFAFETSDRLGISRSEDLPLNRFSIDKLERKYGAAIRDFGWEQ